MLVFNSFSCNSLVYLIVLFRQKFPLVSVIVVVGLANLSCCCDHYVANKRDKKNVRQRTPPSEIILFWSHVTSVFQGLSLSRSIGRVGENPGNEVENQYACHNLSVWHIFNKQPKFTLAQSKCFPPKHINILDREINSLEQAAFLHKVKVMCFLPIPLFYTGKLTINDGWPLHRTWRTLCMNKHLINNAFVKSRW